MRTLGTLAALVVLTTTSACGGQHGSVPPSAAQWHDCDARAVEGSGHVVARFRLDRADPATVRLYGPDGGPCANGLVLQHGASVLGTDVSGMDLDPATVRVVRLHGRLPLVVAESRPHPRGGVQPHLFVMRGGYLAEVVHDGAPVVPFLATDGGGQPVTATCEPGQRIAVWTATAHQPPGIVLAWDVRKTVYDLSGGNTHQESSRLVEVATADPLMRKKMPQLFNPDALLADC